jgi:hypothetical protein
MNMQNEKPRPEGEAWYVGNIAGMVPVPHQLTLLRFYGLNHDKLAHGALVHELDAA